MYVYAGVVNVCLCRCVECMYMQVWWMYVYAGVVGVCTYMQL